MFPLKLDFLKMPKIKFELPNPRRSYFFLLVAQTGLQKAFAHFPGGAKNQNSFFLEIFAGGREKIEVWALKSFVITHTFTQKLRTDTLTDSFFHQKKPL